MNNTEIWSFEQMDAEMLPNGSTAVLLTNNADEYLVEGRLYFDKYSIDTQQLQRLSVILHYNFFALYQEEVEGKITEKMPHSPFHGTAV